MRDATILSFPVRAEDRLRVALRRLDEALDAQRAALGAWRGELAELAVATEDLGQSLETFRDGLDDLASAVRDADAEARRLERTAAVMAALPG